MKNKTVVIRYEKDGTVRAVADSCHEMARILGITPQAVSHAIHRGSKLYKRIEVEENGEE